MNKIHFDLYFTVEILLFSGILLAYGVFSGNVSVFTQENEYQSYTIGKNITQPEIKKSNSTTTGNNNTVNATEIITTEQKTRNENKSFNLQTKTLLVNDTFTSKLPPLNSTKTLRVGAVGDIDCNEEQKTLFQLFKNYKVDLFLIGGDLFYKGSVVCIQNMFYQFGLNGQNTEIAIGDHDNAFVKWITTFTGEYRTYYEQSHNATVSVVVINSNNSGISFSPGSAQYEFIKEEVEGNDLDHSIVMVHQGFQTASSKHQANGLFGDYHPIFKNNGVDVVIQANNHNFQHFDIDGILYLTVGTGTHDQGPALYRIKSQSDGLGHIATKTMDNKNGFVILDLDKFDHSIKGYFIDINNTLLHSFTN